MFSPRPADQVAFDRWVQARLRQEYSAVMHEPVPETLLRLLRDDREPAS